MELAEMQKDLKDKKDAKDRSRLVNTFPPQPCI